MAITLTPATIDFKISDNNAIFKGADWYIEITIESQEGTTITPVDLTGFIGKCQIKESANNSKIIASPVVTIENAIQGTISLSLNDTITKNIPTTGESHKDRTKYVYDVILIKDSEVSRILQGYVEVSPGVTKG